MSANDSSWINTDLRSDTERLSEAIQSLADEITNLGSLLERARNDLVSLEDDVGAFVNMQGDENIAPGNGFIELDRSVAKHPVIRFRADRLPSGGGGEYVGGDDTNITFVECTDPEDARYGKIMIDVYYV